MPDVVVGAALGQPGLLRMTEEANLSDQATTCDLSAAGSLASVGGKGANLGALLRGGFRVPVGFVVTTAAYERVAPTDIAQLLDGDDDGAAVRECIRGARMPPDVAASILRAYRGLGGRAVAVRSSATAEDLPEAAFPGQHDTFLNVIGEDALLDAVRECWASLWTERAVAYRRRQCVEDAAIAVVVQEMVLAEFAGVMFTANPVTGARDEVVIDASEGLGEAVVSGMVAPDHYVLRKHRVVTAQRGRRERAVRPLPEGGTETVAASPNGELPEPVLQQLSPEGKRIEQHFGVPQDIEWAWADGQMFIVQARPITALPPPPPKRRPPNFRPFTMSEALPMRPYPLDVTTWTGALLGAGYEGMAGGGTMPPWDEVCVEEDGVLVWSDLPTPKPSLKSVGQFVQFVVNAVRHDPRDIFADPALTRIVERMRTLGRQDVAQLEWGALHEMVQEAMSTPSRIFALRGRYLPRTFFAIGYVITRLRKIEQQDRLTVLFSDPGAITGKINAEIEELASEIRDDRELRKLFADHEPSQLLDVLSSHPFIRRLEEFLERYGSRETVSLALASQPTWSAQPAVVMGMLKSAAAGNPVPKNEPAAARLRNELLSTGSQGMTSRGLDLIGVWVRLMEDTHFYMSLSLAPIHNAMFEFGRRLVADGLLDEAGDVLHLRLDEVRREPGRREIVARRKAKRAAVEGRPFVQSQTADDADVPADALVHGMPGSPGVAEGPVRVIRDSAEFSKLRQGDVLVAPYTNPAWTPMFQLAAAVVVDTGGGAAHAAIVAREYGIPAIMGTGDATTVLSDDQEILVDGNRGVVLAAE